MTNSKITISVGERDFLLSYFDRPGDGRPIVYVHGLGASKDDFFGMTEQPALKSFRLISYDHPGCGDSPYQPHVGIDDLVELLEAFIEAMKLDNFLLVGGSMGGLIALLYAERNLSRITAFVNVEGNLAPEDCMFSGRVAAHDYSDFLATIFPEIKAGLAARKDIGAARHLKVLERADPRAYYDYSSPTVKYSNDGNLLGRFQALPVRKYFVYGSENRHLSYLPELHKSDCEVIEISNANHFLFYDNPEAFAKVLAECP